MTHQGLWDHRPSWLLLQDVERDGIPAIRAYALVVFYVLIFLESWKTDPQSLLGVEMVLAKSDNKALPSTPRKHLPGS